LHLITRANDVLPQKLPLLQQIKAGLDTLDQDTNKWTDNGFSLDEANPPFQMLKDNRLTELQCIVAGNTRIIVNRFIGRYKTKVPEVPEVPKDKDGILSCCCFRFIIDDSYVDLQARIVQPVSV